MCKDKLYKNGHKKGYYTCKKVAYFSLLSLTVLAAITFPVTFKIVDIVKAEEATKVETVERVNEETTLLEY